MHPGLTSESVDAETRSKLGAAMEASAQRTVRFLLPALAVFYFVLAPVHLAMVPPAHARQMATVAWTTSLVLFAITRIEHRFPSASAHVFLMVAVIAMFVNSVLHFYWLADPLLTINLLLSIVVAGIVILRTRVLIITLAVVLCTWLVLFLRLPDSSSWASWTFSMLTATVIALANNYVHTSNLKQIEGLRIQTDTLLLNILPERVADRLKAGEPHIADEYPSVTILFADIVGFTSVAHSMQPLRLVSILSEVFAAMDALSVRHGVEKIKTIGDAFMAVSGCPIAVTDHAERMAAMALDLLALSSRFAWDDGTPIRFRVGLHTGPVVAGVIGSRKFSFDLWGDTVNTASRMESTGIPGAIQISEQTFEQLHGKFKCEERGPIPIKGKGALRTYLLLG